MSMRNLFRFSSYCLVLFFFVFTFSSPVSAQTSQCIVTKVGNPEIPNDLPKECILAAPIEGVELPPNLTKCISVSGGEYCQLPPALNNEYIKILHHKGAPWQDWGSKEMIGVLYTVARNWQAKYCTSSQITSKSCPAHLVIGDIASYYHKTHDYGTAVDVTATTDGNDCAANHVGGNRCRYYPPYNSQATIELGRLFVKTGWVRQILYWDTKTNVISELRKITNVGTLSDHPDHFHVDIKRAKLPNCEFTSPRAC